MRSGQKLKLSINEDWAEIEVMNLQDEVADLEAERDHLTDMVGEAESACWRWERRYHELRFSSKLEMHEQNQKISDQLITFVSLTEEYRKVIDLYSDKTGVLLTNKRIKKLEHEGGF